MYPIASVDLVFELVLHRGGYKVPHTRRITAILGNAAGPSHGGVFNPGLTLLVVHRRATIRLMYGEATPAWRNLGECVSFESHSRLVHGALDSFDIVSRVTNSF